MGHTLGAATPSTTLTTRVPVVPAPVGEVLADVVIGAGVVVAAEPVVGVPPGGTVDDAADVDDDRTATVSFTVSPG